MLIDSHCHIPNEAYEKSIEDILSESKKEGVDKLINIGNSLQDNEAAAAVCEEFSEPGYPEIYCVLGIYPHENSDISTPELKNKLLEQISRTRRVVGIGECGVDIGAWENGRNLDQQLELFEMHIEIASQKELPLVIHNRNGNDPILEVLSKWKKRSPGLCGVMHCFSSDWEYAKEVLGLDFYISFTGMITYPKKDTLLEVIRNVPMDRFLVETDSPWLPPQSHRGQVNYPKYVKIVAEKIAQVKEKPFEEIARASYDNTCTLFSLL